MEGVFLEETSVLNDYDCLLTEDTCNFNCHSSDANEDISRVMFQSECDENILDVPAIGVEAINGLVVFPMKYDESGMMHEDTAVDLSVFAEEAIAASSTMNIISDDTAAVVADPAEIVDEVPATTFVANKRPRRAAAILAEKRVNEVLKWEKCKESSSMFKNVAIQINEEFDRVGRGGRKKKSVLVVDDRTFQAVSPVASGSRVVIPVIEVSSDDEGAADVDCPDVDMHNDNDDDLDNDDDESGSLASFVVSDSYMSEAEGISDADSVCEDSDSEGESNGAEDSPCDSDSDGDFSASETDSECENADQGKWSDEAKA